jgi:hypothetical protein
MPAWVVDSCWRSAFHLFGRVETGGEATGKRFAIGVAAVGLGRQLGVWAVGAGLLEQGNAVADAACRPEGGQGPGGATHHPPIDGLGQDQIPADDGHDGQDDRHAVRNSVAAGPQVRETEGVFLHLIAPI